MYRYRATYWSNSKLAKLLTRRVAGIEPMEAGTSEEFKAHDDIFKAKSPKLYFLIEEVFDRIQNIVMFPSDVLSTVRSYFRNRFIEKSHLLQCKLPKGQYHEVDRRILHGLFETLVEFVEGEKAWMMVVFDDGEKWAQYNIPRWYMKYRFLRWGNFRNKQAGLDYLDWEISLDQEAPTQSATAKEVKELYLWWTTVYCNREDPSDSSGWSAFCDTKYKDNCMFSSLKDPADVDEEARLLEAYHRIEEEQHQEDEDMMIRLIKVRRSLWT